MSDDVKNDPGQVDLWRRRLLLAVPLVAAGAIGAGFWTILRRMETGRFDPHDTGSPMLGRALPDFSLPGFKDAPGFSAQDVRDAAKTGPVILNFFASWCIPCASEAPVLADLAKDRDHVRLWGIAYEDKTAALDNFLTQGGNPYTRLAMDEGRVAIDFGVTGVPETFVVDRSGVIAWHLVGPLDDDTAKRSLLPRLAQL